MNRPVGTPLRLRLAGALVPLLCVLPLAAQPMFVEPCHELDDDRRRLACYDRASGRIPSPPPAPAAATPPAGSPAAAGAVTSGTASAAQARPPQLRTSLLGARWGLDPWDDSPNFNLRLHNPNYILVARYSDKVNNDPFTPIANAANEDLNLDQTEVKFGLSLKMRLWNTEDRKWAVWAAYTQQNNWQVYNDSISRPFRETNYSPEVIVSYKPDLEWGDGWRWRVLNMAFIHQSNGRADPLSRSWNRLYAQFGIEKNDFALYVRPWWRIPESSADDDNPDITDYMGYGDVTAFYKWNNHAFTLMGRGNLNKGKGAAQFDWSFPLPFKGTGPLKGYLQVFSGYGESLIDYNFNQTTIGIGFSVNDIL